MKKPKLSVETGQVQLQVELHAPHRRKDRTARCENDHSHPSGRLAERAEGWKARYEALQNSHIKTELDLPQAEAERDEAKSAAEKLRTDNAALLELLEVSGDAKVISLHLRKK